jgi:hypothetical protein
LRNIESAEAYVAARRSTNNKLDFFRHGSGVQSNCAARCQETQGSPPSQTLRKNWPRAASTAQGPAAPLAHRPARISLVRLLPSRA